MLRITLGFILLVSYIKGAEPTDADTVSDILACAVNANDGLTLSQATACATKTSTCPACGVNDDTTYHATVITCASSRSVDPADLKGYCFPNSNAICRICTSEAPVVADMALVTLNLSLAAAILLRF